MLDFAIGKYFLRFVIDKSFLVFGTCSHLLFRIEAAYLLTGHYLDQRRFLFKAFLRRVLASGCEFAALGQIQRMRNRARNGFKANARRGIQTRDGEHQALGIGMGILVFVEDRLSGRVFDDLAAVHDHNTVGDFGDDTEIVRDGVTFLVDSLSFQYLVGAEIDYKDDLEGSQFVIRNPNAVTTCSCGSSFSA